MDRNSNQSGTGQADDDIEENVPTKIGHASPRIASEATMMKQARALNVLVMAQLIKAQDGPFVRLEAGANGQEGGSTWPFQVDGLQEAKKEVSLGVAVVGCSNLPCSGVAWDDTGGGSRGLGRPFGVLLAIGEGLGVAACVVTVVVYENNHSDIALWLAICFGAGTILTAGMVMLGRTFSSRAQAASTDPAGVLTRNGPSERTLAYGPPCNRARAHGGRPGVPAFLTGSVG